MADRLNRAMAHGVRTIDVRRHGKDLAEVVCDMTRGRGADSVIDAVGMEAHGSPVGKVALVQAGDL